VNVVCNFSRGRNTGVIPHLTYSRVKAVLICGSSTKMLFIHLDGKAGRKPPCFLIRTALKCSSRPEEAMPSTLFDILKKDPKGTFHWIESVRDIDTAEARLRKLSAESADEFVVFRNIDLRVVATYCDRQYKRL
jgi:hypothetical protein